MKYLDDLRETALGAPDLWGQVYLTGRWVLGFDDQRSRKMADKASRSFNEKPCISHEELQVILESVMTENETAGNSKEQEIQQSDGTTQEDIDRRNNADTPLAPGPDISKDDEYKSALVLDALISGYQNQQALHKLFDMPFSSLARGNAFDFSNGLGYPDGLTVQMAIERPTQINHLDFSGCGESLVSLAIVNPAESITFPERGQLLDALEIARSALMHIADISGDSEVNAIVNDALVQSEKWMDHE